MEELYVEGKGTRLKLQVTHARILDEKDLSGNLKKELAQAKNIDVTQDLMYMRFVLCHEGTNINLDTFVLDELQQNYASIIYKDVNVEHSNQIIGCIVDSELIEDEADASFQESEEFRPYVVCDAVIYQFKFPEIAEEIRDRFSKNDLSFSMECWFEKAECSICGESFSIASEYCDHLQDRKASGATRILREITFGGAAVVESPADEDAVGLTVAARELENWEAESIADAIGDSIENFRKVFETYMEKLSSNSIINMDAVWEEIASMLTPSSTEVQAKLITASTKATNKGGNSVAFEFETKEELLKDPVVVEAIAEAVQAELEKSDAMKDMEKRVSDMESEKADMQDKLDLIEAEKQAIQDQFDTYKNEVEAEKKEKELDELAESRFKELTESGVKYPEDRIESVKSRLRGMDEETYSGYKEDLLSNLTKASVDDEEEEEIPLIPNLASASEGKYAWESGINKFAEGFKGTFKDDGK